MPRYALYRGKRVRVLNYVQTNLWRVLSADDTVRLVSGAHLTFLP